MLFTTDVPQSKVQAARIPILRLQEQESFRIVHPVYSPTQRRLKQGKQA